MCIRDSRGIVALEGGIAVGEPGLPGRLAQFVARLRGPGGGTHEVALLLPRVLQLVVRAPYPRGVVAFRDVTAVEVERLEGVVLRLDAADRGESPGLARVAPEAAAAASFCCPVPEQEPVPDLV